MVLLLSDRIELVSIDEFLANAKNGNMTDPFAVLGAYDELVKMKGAN